MPALGRLRLLSGARRRFPLAAALAAGLAVGATALPTAGQSPPPDSTFSPARARYDAVRAMREGRYAEVISLTAALGEAPEVRLLRGRALAAVGRYDDAAREWQAASVEEPLGEAQYELGLLEYLRGRRAEARKLLEPLVAAGARSEDGEALGRAARAAHRLGRFEQANTLFRDAAALIGDDATLQIAWGDLLLEKQNRPDAVKSYRAALQSDRRSPAAFVGLARAFADENGGAARDLATRALGVNPSFVPAYLLLADLALDEDRRADAQSAIDQALAINPRSLDALARQAAIAFLEDRTADFDRLVAGVLAINPKFGDVYRIAGAQAARHYRFQAAADLAKRAIALEPGNVRAVADLGVHLLRTGDEAAARAALDRAFQADPYDVVSYNLLGLLDTLEKFETIEDGPIVMRLHPDEAPVMREHALPLARQALQTLAARYQFQPNGPILVEMFPRHDDFAVRNVGLPGMIGALGACFGSVVTLDSPRARPPGTFNWQATLWHEMAHVITLQMSGNRIPRWLTEGISVFEEQRAHPEWGREMELRFADALDAGELLRLPDLNAGFMSPETISLAYYEASLLVDHIVVTRGEDALRTLIRAFGDGLDMDAAMRRAIGPTLAEMEPEFMASMQERFASTLAARRGPEDLRLTSRTPRDMLEGLALEYPGNYEIHLRLGEVRALAGDADGAYAAWEQAATALPAAVGSSSALGRLAALALQREDTPRAIEALERLLARDDTNIDAARQLAGLIDPVAAPDRAARAWARVAALDPFDATASAALGRQALAARDAAAAARWFRAALAAGPKDRAAAHCDLAETYLATGSRLQAKRQVLAALEVAPSYARAQDLLLTIVDGAQ